MYRFTKNKKYKEQARKIAAFILSHPALPPDKVPYWDYDAPGIPATYRDASAAAVAASALLELSRYVGKKERAQYLSAAVVMLQTLSSDEYLAAEGSNSNFLLKHSVGSLPGKSEVDAPLIYADYYFIEALLRYKKWYLQ